MKKNIAAGLVLLTVAVAIGAAGCENTNPASPTAITEVESASAQTATSAQNAATTATATDATPTLTDLAIRNANHLQGEGKSANDYFRESCTGSGTAIGEYSNATLPEDITDENTILTCLRRGDTKDSIYVSKNRRINGAWAADLPPNKVDPILPSTPPGYARIWIPVMHIGGSSISVDCDNGWRIRRRRRITQTGFLKTGSFTVFLTIRGRTLEIPNVCTSRTL